MAQSVILYSCDLERSRSTGRSIKIFLTPNQVAVEAMEKDFTRFFPEAIGRVRSYINMNVVGPLN